MTCTCCSPWPACEAVCDAVAARWDGLDLLVNNASVFYPVPFADIDADAA